MRNQYPNWTLIEWDGNPELKLKCWRKSFRAGHVSVGVRDFDLVCYSYGPNSDYSISGTRWNYGAEPISETDMMAWVDKNDGRHAPYPIQQSVKDEFYKKHPHIKP